ncbi:MAG TPA: hypothetical protein VNE86_03385 [Nitrososphaerales archaeon]|nr:hypothetical protein [Nitrososphaerales archaeon]
MPDRIKRKRAKRVLTERELLEQIRDLLIENLRTTDISPAALGKLTGLKEKTITNQFPSIKAKK